MLQGLGKVLASQHGACAAQPAAHMLTRRRNPATEHRLCAQRGHRGAAAARTDAERSQQQPHGGGGRGAGRPGAASKQSCAADRAAGCSLWADAMLCRRLQAMRLLKPKAGSRLCAGPLPRSLPSAGAVAPLLPARPARACRAMMYISEHEDGQLAALGSPPCDRCGACVLLAPPAGDVH